MKSVYSLMMSGTLLAVASLSMAQTPDKQSGSSEYIRPTGKDIVDFQIKVKDYANKPVVLGYYFNSKMLVKDTVLTDAACVAHFKRDTLLDEGLYIVHFPENGSLFDLMMPHEQKFSIECDTLPRTVERLTVKGSDVVSRFVDYQRYLQKRQAQYGKLMNDFRMAGDDEAKKSDIRKRFNEIDSLVKVHNNVVIAQNSNNFLGTFIKALKEVEVPKYTFPDSYTKQQRDSATQIKGYYHYRAHFYDNLDMTDARLLRTPFFPQKIDKYFKETVPQIPDTVAAEAIRLIEMCRKNKEMFRYFVSTMYNMVNQSKIMGMDAALVKIADRYYLSGEADWAEEKFIEDLRENIDGIRHCLIGLTAPDLKMPSVTGEWHQLSELKAEYTILAFWEPSCGHCKKEIPHLKKAVLDKYAKYGVKVFAVYCQVEEKPWKEFIEEHQLEEFINVYDPYGRSGFRKFYHIKSTPSLFVLDKDKKIIAKKLDVDQIDDFLTHELGLPAPKQEAEIQ